MTSDVSSVSISLKDFPARGTLPVVLEEGFAEELVEGRFVIETAHWREEALRNDYRSRVRGRMLSLWI